MARIEPGSFKLTNHLGKCLQILSLPVQKSRTLPGPTLNTHRPIWLSGYSVFSWPLGNHTHDFQNTKFRLTTTMPPRKPNTWELRVLRGLPRVKEVAVSSNKSQYCRVTGRADVGPLSRQL